MLMLWQKLVDFFHREFTVNSRQGQRAEQTSMLIGVRSAEEDLLMKLRELDKVLGRER